MNNNREEYKDVHALMDEFKEDVSGYLNNRLSYYKFRTYEKASLSGGFIMYGFMIAVLFLVTLILILLALGFWLGEILHSYAAGFGILIVVSVFILLIGLASAKKIRRIFANLIVKIIHKVESDEE